MRLFFNLTAIAGLATVGIATAIPGLSKRAENVNIMALGDSITGSPGCWRALLWQQLQDASINNTDFVGSLPAPGCGFTYDGENEGHGGILATEIVSQDQLPPWLESAQPDIVMMHLGTNDVWNDLGAEVIIEAFTTMVDQMRENNPAMTILVAQIIPMSPDGCTTCGQGVEDLNAAIAEWAPTLSTANSNITVVDCFTGFDSTTDTGDGVHPNEAGDEKLADSWYEPLAKAIQQVGGA